MGTGPKRLCPSRPTVSEPVPAALRCYHGGRGILVSSFLRPWELGTTGGSRLHSAPLLFLLLSFGALAVPNRETEIQYRPKRGVEFVAPGLRPSRHIIGKRLEQGSNWRGQAIRVRRFVGLPTARRCGTLGPFRFRRTIGLHYVRSLPNDPSVLAESEKQNDHSRLLAVRFVFSESVAHPVGTIDSRINKGENVCIDRTDNLGEARLIFGLRSLPDHDQVRSVVSFLVDQLQQY